MLLGATAVEDRWVTGRRTYNISPEVHNVLDYLKT